jgi:AmmeMemoRadiSam system protein B
MLGLADARQISDRIVYCTPAVQHILPLMDGKHSLDDIVRQIGQGLTRTVLEQLVAQLDEAYLLEGPRFNELLAKVRADFDSSDTLPPASTAAFADMLVEMGVRQKGEEKPASPEDLAERGARKLREILDQWMDTVLKDAPVRRFTEFPRAIVAPHLDYPRGWLNYAGAWGRMRGLPAPDRVIILGTNHFGASTGVCGCDKGYRTPLGVCEADHDLIAAVRRRLGTGGAERLFENRYDHEREHSIELQIPWIQHVFGADGRTPRVFGVLVHDPSVNEGRSYDGKGLDLEPFIDAMQGAISDVGGTTLIVSSADLSHAGPAFGDQHPLAGDSPEAVQERNRIVQHDREMLQLFGQGKVDDLVTSMAWQQNPTRWCSLGNMVAAFRIARPTKIELLNYAAAMDPSGYTFVSNACMVMT